MRSSMHAQDCTEQSRHQDAFGIQPCYVCHYIVDGLYADRSLWPLPVCIKMSPETAMRIGITAVCGSLQAAQQRFAKLFSLIQPILVQGIFDRLPDSSYLGQGLHGLLSGHVVCCSTGCRACALCNTGPRICSKACHTCTVLQLFEVGKS